MRRPRTAALLAGVALVAAGCSAEVSFGNSSGPDTFAEALIEEELVEESGFDELAADCDEPADSELNTQFSCTATTESGETIDFTATIDGEDSVNVQTLNLITPSGLDRLEAAAVEIIEGQAGRPLGVENFDCGAGPVVTDGDRHTVDCDLTDPESGEVFGSQVTVNGLDTDDPTLDVVVDEQPS